MPSAIKFAADESDVLEILAVPFGGPEFLGGKDVQGEYFSPKTDLCLGWFPDRRPLIYDHGLDSSAQTEVIGFVDTSTARKSDDGWWVKAQLDKSSRYFERIKQLVEQSTLFASSGSMPHLVQRTKGGEITRWPWVELSLTPHPANLLAVILPSDAAKHFKSAGIDFDPATVKAPESSGLKADDESIPAQGFYGDAPEGSYEDLIEDINRALAQRFGPGGYGFAVATFPAYTVARYRCSDFSEQHDADSDECECGFYRIAYTLGDDGEPILGDATTLELRYVPTKSADALTLIPLAHLAERATHLQAVLEERTKDVLERRASEGRTLSRLNRNALSEVVAAGRKSLSDLEDLLADREPEAVKAVDPNRLRDLDARQRALKAGLDS